ncbi:MAG: hypothetical protein LBR64_01290 [Dysgonamonadaceae bacterium]|jgi:hypothetical protein|nr:hypothetical protein [Dysgonamonadaceae bacterium]
MSSIFDIFKRKNEETPPAAPDSNSDSMKDTIRGELEMDFQPANLKKRITTGENASLGWLLGVTFDVKKEEILNMFFVSNIENMSGKLLANPDEIWDFDLASTIVSRHGGNFEAKPDEQVELIITCRKNSVIIVHLRESGGLIAPASRRKSSVYICATVCIPPDSYKKQNIAVGQYERLQGRMLSVTFACDSATASQRVAEFRYMRDEAFEKIAQNRINTLTNEQRFMLNNIYENAGLNFYFAQKALDEKRFTDAIFFFTLVYDDLQERWLKNSITDEERDLFFNACYFLGFCYSELGMYEKALYFLEIVCYINNVGYKIEYINCLVNKKDFRAYSTVTRELDRISKIRRSEWTQDMDIYLQFLRRRQAYCYIDMNRLDEAEKIFREMLDEEGNHDFAINELAYIQRKRKAAQ